MEQGCKNAVIRWSNAQIHGSMQNDKYDRFIKIQNNFKTKKIKHCTRHRYTNQRININNYKYTQRKTHTCYILSLSLNR